MKEQVTVPSVPKSDSRGETGLRFLGKLLRTSLMVVWETMKSSRCPSPKPDLILRAKKHVEGTKRRLQPLGDLHNLIAEASRSNQRRIAELPG